MEMKGFEPSPRVSWEFDDKIRAVNCASKAPTTAPHLGMKYGRETELNPVEQDERPHASVEVACPWNRTRI